jgi:hypothetical protein
MDNYLPEQPNKILWSIFKKAFLILSVQYYPIGRVISGYRLGETVNITYNIQSGKSNFQLCSAKEGEEIMHQVRSTVTNTRNRAQTNSWQRCHISWKMF